MNWWIVVYLCFLVVWLITFGYVLIGMTLESIRFRKEVELIVNPLKDGQIIEVDFRKRW